MDDHDLLLLAWWRERTHAQQAILVSVALGQDALLEQVLGAPRGLVAARSARLLARFHDGGYCLARLPSIVDPVPALATADEALAMLPGVAAESRREEPLEDPLPTRVLTNPEDRAELLLSRPRQARLHASGLQEMLSAWRMATEERLRRFHQDLAVSVHWTDLDPVRQMIVASSALWTDEGLEEGLGLPPGRLRSVAQTVLGGPCRAAEIARVLPRQIRFLPSFSAADDLPGRLLAVLGTPAPSRSGGEPPRTKPRLEADVRMQTPAGPGRSMTPDDAGRPARALLAASSPAGTLQAVDEHTARTAPAPLSLPSAEEGQAGGTDDGRSPSPVEDIPCATGLLPSRGPRKEDLRTALEPEPPRLLDRIFGRLRRWLRKR
jgi:hypothetical protein